MKKYAAFSCIVSCLFFGAMQSKATDCASVPDNLVANCGFETGDFTGWTLSGNDVPGQEGVLYGVEGTDPDGTAPLDGSYQAYFGDLDSNATTLSQSIATTPGDQYTITFYAAQDTTPSEGYGNELQASFGGQSLVSQSDIAAQGYTGYSYIVDATSGTSTLDLTFGNDLGYFQLDDVSVQNTPEPGSFLLFGTGLLALAGLARRRLSTL